MVTRAEQIRPKLLDTRGVVYFPSGSYNPGEIRGFLQSGFNVGTTALLPKAKLPLAEWELAQAADTGARVFIDSGAFSEIQFQDEGPPIVVKPITPEKWDRIFAQYERLAQRLGPQLYIVAPDRVAFQGYTLSLLNRYADRLRELHRLGAQIIVPHQKGELSLAQFNKKAKEILGFPFIVGVPMKKDATTLSDIVSMLLYANIDRLHLLGMGPNRPAWTETIETIRGVRPDIDLSADSVLIRALVGKTGGPGGGPRALTASYQEVAEELGERTFSETAGGIDYTDLISEPSAWMTKADQKRFVDAIGLRGEERRRALDDLDEWLQEDDHYLWPHIELELDALWEKWFTGPGSVEWRKKKGIKKTFGETRTTEKEGQVKLF